MDGAKIATLTKDGTVLALHAEVPAEIAHVDPALWPDMTWWPDGRKRVPVVMLPDAPHDPVAENLLWKSWVAEDGRSALCQRQPEALPAEIAAERKAAALVKLEAHFEEVVQGHIDAVAQAKRYRNGERLAGYKDDPRWGAEATDFVNWRSDVWHEALAHQAKVLAGAEPVPTDAELIALLPAPPWPVAPPATPSP